MVARGKAVRNAGRSGRHERTKPRRKTQSIGPDIEGCEVNEVQIPVTKIEPQRPFLDTLDQSRILKRKIMLLSEEEEVTSRKYQAASEIVQKRQQELKEVTGRLVRIEATLATLHKYVQDVNARIQRVEDEGQIQETVSID